MSLSSELSLPLSSLGKNHHYRHHFHFPYLAVYTTLLLSLLLLNLPHPVMSANSSGSIKSTTSSGIPTTKKTTTTITNINSVNRSSSSSNNNNNNNQMVRIRFYFVRHGESAANKWGLLAGQDDVPLTIDGIIEAQTLGSKSIFIKDTDFWRIYSSDLCRAKDTATYALTAAGQQPLVLQMVLDPILRERSYGPKQGFSKRISEAEALLIWKSHNVPPPPYETDADLWERGKAFMKRMIQDVRNVQSLEKDILLVGSLTPPTSTQSSQATTTTTAAATTTRASPSSSSSESAPEIYLHGSLANKLYVQSSSQQQVQVPPQEDNTKIYNILVTSHAGLIREIILQLTTPEELQALGAKYDATRNNRLIIPNTSVTILEIIDPFIEEDDLVLDRTNIQILEFANADHLTNVNYYYDD